MQWSIMKRPTVLDDLFGCENIKSYFYNRVKEGKDYPTAVLLSGQFGSGKTTSAKIIAKMMTCKNPKANGDPCNECLDCKAVDSESWSRDVMMIDGGQSGKADLTDRIEEFTLTPPIRGKRKVVIIEEIQELSTAAKNSLLKALETPREKIHFVFLTMDNPTASGFVSRCVPLKFKFIPVTDLMKYLAFILKEENLWESLPLEFKTEGLLIIAQNAQGSIRLALQLLETVLDMKAYTKAEISEKTGMYSELEFMGILRGVLSGENSERMFDALLNPADYQATFNLLFKVVSDAVAFRTFGHVPGDSDSFRRQAAEISSNPNFDLVKDTLVDLQMRSTNYLKKAVYMCVMADLVMKCRANSPVSTNVNTPVAITTPGPKPLPLEPQATPTPLPVRPVRPVRGQ